MKFSILLTLALSYTTLSSAQNFRRDNADKAEQLQKEFAKLNKNSPCENNAQACVEDQFAQCVGGKFQLNSCGGGDLKCVVLPLVNKPGTSITCSTEADRLARLADARGESPDQGKTPDQSKTPKQGKAKNGKKAPNQGNGKNRKRAPGNEKEGKIPDNEKEGKLPGQDNGKNGKEGNLPGQDNGKDGNDGKLPGQDNGKDGKDGKLPGQDNGKDGKDGKLPGQDNGKDGKLPGQDNEKCNCKCPNNGNDGNDDGNGKDGNDKDGKEPDNGSEPEPGNGDNEKEPDNGSEPEPDNGDNGKEPNNGSEPEPDNEKEPDNGKTPPKNDDKLQTPPANGGDNLSAIQKKNIAAAKALQEKFDKLTPNDECNNDEVACVDNKFAQCSGGKFALTDCAAGTVCSALPLVLKEGTTVACTTQADRDARLNPKK